MRTAVDTAKKIFVTFFFNVDDNFKMLLTELRSIIKICDENFKKELKKKVQLVKNPRV